MGRSFLIISCISAFVAATVLSVPLAKEIGLKKATADKNYYDYYAFAQFWPETQCMYVNDTFASHYCLLSTTVTTWTVHGLWPTRNYTTEPNSCNASWPFREKEIQALESSLSSHWPTYETDKPCSSLWAHEWAKHGTCAVINNTFIHDEKDYFAVGLKLRTLYGLEVFLRNHKIIPSDHETYEFDSIMDALKYELGGSRALVDCAYSNETKAHYLNQVTVCFSKSFTVIDCYSVQNVTNTQCPEKNIYYPIITYPDIIW